MLREERELYDWAVDMFGLDVPNVRSNRVIKHDLRRLMKNMRRAVIEDVLRVARECHHFHRCNHLDPCELCLMMNPNWKSAAAIQKGGKAGWI